MARIQGIDLPKNKKRVIGLTYILWYRIIILKINFRKCKYFS